jgi:LysM repeat protein
MNPSNPLLPQGAEPPKPRVQSSIRIAVATILTIHAALFAGLLVQGCKPETQNQAEAEPSSGFEPSMFPPTQDPALAGDASTAPMPPPPISVDGAVVPTPPPPGEFTTAVVPPQPVPGSDVAAPAIPAIPETPMAEPKTHVVAKGEVIEIIAKKYGVTSAAVLAANPKVDPKRMQIGTKLVIPAPTATASNTSAPAPSLTGEPQVYAVKSGDNLTKIAKQFGVTINELRTANGLKTDRLNVGQKLKIPAKMASGSDGVPTAQGGPPPLPVPPPPQ